MNRKERLWLDEISIRFTNHGFIDLRCLIATELICKEIDFNNKLFEATSKEIIEKYLGILVLYNYVDIETLDTYDIDEVINEMHDIVKDDVIEIMEETERVCKSDDCCNASYFLDKDDIAYFKNYMDENFSDSIRDLDY